MSLPANKMKEIFKFLQANKYEEIKKDYLLDMISFDDLKEDEHGDTLLHYFFRQFDEINLLPVSALEFLIQCFFRVDHYNNEDKTAVHILLEKHSDAYKHFDCFIKRGIPLFQKKGESLSIFELLISTDNQIIFQYLIARFNLDYIDKFYYDISLSLAIKYQSISIFDNLINDIPFHLSSLFQKFLNNVQPPTDEDDDTSANAQFFLAIKNSKKRIFQKIFDTRPNDKFVTLEMLYHCSDTSFCIYLSRYVKDEEYLKISVQNDQNIPPEIFRLVTEINSKVYGSRSIIHQAVQDNKLDFIRLIPPIMYDALDYSGNTPLYYAIKYDKNDVAKYLLKSGNCDFCHLGRASTPLHVAVKGHPEILKKMLSIVNKKKYKFPFDINVKDRKGSTPLLAPFFSEPSKSNNQKDINTNCLMLIIENGADIQACDSKGNNILYYTFEHYFDMKSEEFVSFILSQKNLTITEDGKKSLLIQLYNQNNQYIIDIFHKRIDVDPDLLKIIFSKCNSPKIEKPYLLLKEQGKENDFFFECLKTVNEKVFNSMLKTIDNLVFYIDENDDNNNVLFILANSSFKQYLHSIITTIFESIIDNNRFDFLLSQSKENGENFLHLAIRRRNNFLIQIFIDIYKKNEKKILQNFDDKNRERIWSYVNQLFNQKNNNEKNKQSPMELGMFVIPDFHNIFHSEIFNIFKKEPSIEELKNFLEKYHSPNIIYENEPLIMKYVKYDKFDEDEMLKILELFNSYDCNFIVNQNDDYVALILLKKYYFKALNFLLDHRGLGKYSANVMDIINDSKKAVEILNLYNNSKNSVYIVNLYNEFKGESSSENLNDEQENHQEKKNFANDPQKNEFIMKVLEKSQEEEVIKITDNHENVKIINNFSNNIKMENLINDIMRNHRDLTNVWDVIHDENKEELVLNLIEDNNTSRNIKNNFDYFKKNEKNIILIDVRFINEEISRRIIKYANYYDAFRNLKKYIENADAIQKAIETTVQEKEKHDEDNEKFWSILPVIQRFSAFNAHCKLMINSFEEILLFETPIEKFFDVFVPYFESLYGPFYIQILSIQKQYTDEQISRFMTESSSIIGNFMTITNFFAAFESNISDLIKYNLNDSMKKKLLIPKEKCLDVVEKIQVYSPHYEEFKSIIANHKIVYDIDFDISQMPSKFYQVFVNVVDSTVDCFSPEKRLNEYYLICSDEIILVASVDSDEVHFLFEQSTSTVFCQTFFNHIQSKLKLFTLDGMIEFEQIDLNGDKLKILYNIGKLMIEAKLSKLNKSFEDQWNLQRKSNIDSNELVNIDVSYIDDKTMYIITYHFKYNRNADVEEIKEVVGNQISQNLYKNDRNLIAFNL